MRCISMEIFRYEDLVTLAYALPEDVLCKKEYGDFEGAQKLIDVWLSRDVSELLKRRLRLEKQILARLPVYFPYTQEQCLAKVQEVLPDITAEEFVHLKDNGRIDWIYVNGEEHYFHRTAETLMTDPALKKRSDVLLNRDQAEPEDPVKDVVKEMADTGRPVSYRFSLKAEYRIKDEVFHPGRVRVWLPVPRASEQISGIQILTTNGILADEHARQRTICFEEDMKENHVFSAEYAWTVTARYADLWNRGERSIVYAENSPAPCAEDTSELLPHIQFTPYMKALAKEIAGNIEDPLEKARAFYDYITARVKYSFMRPYATVEEIPEYAAVGYKGDCGVKALMFITLCRLAGIPARWQSGLTTGHEAAGNHDWAQFWIDGYGWLFCDPSYGGHAYDEGEEWRRRFYFGNLDPFRMVANNSFQAQFDNIQPRYLRADPYDNQVGEAEYEEEKILDCAYTKTVTGSERIR